MTFMSYRFKKLSNTSLILRYWQINKNLFDRHRVFTEIIYNLL